jgi:hypothetical protein
MLIVNIPEPDLLQHAGCVRDLEENRCVRLIGERASNHPHKRSRLMDVLQGHLADDEICTQMGIFFGIEIGDERHTLAGARQAALRDIRRVDADAAIFAQVAQQGNELTFAAPDFNDVLPVQVVAFDQMLCQPPRKGIERWRIPLRFFVAFGILVERRIERRIADKSARAAKAEANIAARIGDGFLAGGEQQYAVHRHTLQFVEDLHSDSAATRTGYGRHGVPLSHKRHATQ